MAEKGLGQASGTPQRSSATPRLRSTPRRSLPCSVVVLRRGVATVHSMVNFGALFCFTFLLLRGLVYWINEDLISV